MKTFNNILAIETSGPICSIALRSEKRIESACSKNENEHGLVILNFIEKLLKKSGLKKNELDLIAISNGPGSFTGLRVANSVAQALAFANNIPLLPISSLAVLANQASIKLEKNRIFVIVNAHMKELYVADYFCKKDVIDILKKETLIKIENLSDSIEKNNFEICYVGNGTSFLKKMVKDFQISEVIHSDASSMFNLIDTAIKDKLYSSAEKITPNYLSGEDHWKKVD